MLLSIVLSFTQYSFIILENTKTRCIITLHRYNVLTSFVVIFIISYCVASQPNKRLKTVFMATQSESPSESTLNNPRRHPIPSPLPSPDVPQKNLDLSALKLSEVGFYRLRR